MPKNLREIQRIERPVVEAVEEQVGDRDDDEGEHGRGDHAADDDDGHRGAGLTALAEGEGDGDHAEDGRGGGHDDRAQADAAGLDQGVGMTAPWARSPLVKSTSRIAVLVTRPISMMRPMNEKMLRVMPAR
jgi:hypothetical protein